MADTLKMPKDEAVKAELKSIHCPILNLKTVKVPIANIKDNPFRRFDLYPINAGKVKYLKACILDSRFWPIIIARPHKQKYQLAFGHHRIRALADLNCQTIPLLVANPKDLTDPWMIRMMIFENLDSGNAPLEIIMAGVAAAKEYLETELPKYTWEQFLKSELDDFIRFKNAQAFGQAIGKKGIGRNHLVEFIGGKIRPNKVQRALEALELIEKSIGKQIKGKKEKVPQHLEDYSHLADLLDDLQAMLENAAGYLEIIKNVENETVKYRLINNIHLWKIPVLMGKFLNEYFAVHSQLKLDDNIQSTLYDIQKEIEPWQAIRTESI